MNDSKPKKPPACDRCKAKRVLCHPNPNGCPRCVEKGVLCTTTPVQRRKRRRAGELDVDSGRSSREPTLTLPEVPAGAAVAGTAAGPTPQSDLLHQAPPDLSTTFETAAPRPAAAVSAVPLHDTSLMRYQNLSLPFFRDDASTSHSPAPSFYGAQQVVLLPQEPVLTPELAMALYEGFRQSTRYDQPLMQFTTVHSALTTNSWFIDLLPPATRALALATFAIGSLYTFDPAIIGPSPFRSYSDIEWRGRDLRPYGRKRRRAFEGLRDAALRAAKENEVTVVPSVDNAACCVLIDVLLQMDDTAQSRLLGARPYYRAYVSHVTALVATGNAPVSDMLGGGTWAIHLSSDMWSELCSGRLTLTPEDQKLLLERDTVPDVAAIKKQYRDLLTTSKLEDWPAITPFCHLFMATARSLVSELLAPHLRNRDIDPAVLTRLVQSIADVQEVSILHRQLWSRQIKFIEATIPAPGADTSTPPPLFQHANSRRIRWNRLQAARGARDFGAFLWASMVVPLYREVRRRANVTTEAEREAASPSFSHAYRAEQLKLLVQQARALVVAAVETHIQLFESTPGMALLASTSATGIADAFELFVDLVENCDLPRDDKVASLAASAAEVLKVGGWVYASTRFDHLIASLEDLHGSLSPTSIPGPGPTETTTKSHQWAGPPLDVADSPLPPPPPTTMTGDGTGALPQIDLEQYAHISSFDPLSPSWLFAAGIADAVSGGGGDSAAQAFATGSQAPTSPDLFASVVTGGTDWAAAAEGTASEPGPMTVAGDAASRLFADLTSQSDAAFVASSTLAAAQGAGQGWP
ncbi:hypothetical protein BMF94_0717 [Rhodotorula taiwanensis]|uniref:Zn(2)-C6 fungal-type domain-containing protein n=1 Tax=Rhodotorula taiwanensis TaxID=741276 RepID=A0A2S5BHF0_9BASI|nr:hypothetical protein BMF94_0717 [Rhodotorula taiwanensis]